MVHTWLRTKGKLHQVTKGKGRHLVAFHCVTYRLKGMFLFIYDAYTSELIRLFTL